MNVLIDLDDDLSICRRLVFKTVSGKDYAWFSYKNTSWLVGDDVDISRRIIDINSCVCYDILKDQLSFDLDPECFIPVAELKRSDILNQINMDL